MEPLKRSFSCAFEDLPAIGKFVLDSALRDKAHLATKSTKYKTDDFLDKYAASLKAVNELVNPTSFTAQHKKLTEQIEADSKAIRPLLNDLEIRLADAAELPATGPQLSINPPDFGLKLLRTAITNGDAEAIAYAGQALLGNLTANAAALTLVEYPPADQAELIRLLTVLAKANAEQNQLISARDARVQSNLAVLNDFYDRYAARVIADGKKAYKESDPAKTHDYTFARLYARVKAQRPTASKSPAQP